LQRKQVKAMLREWEKRHPGRVETMFRSLTQVVPSHLLDRNLFDFAAARADGIGGEAGRDADAAFDVDPDLEAAIARATHAAPEGAGLAAPIVLHPSAGRRAAD
jgi:tRNA 2-thiocytidine biosynthesis protein TtcA